MTTFGTIILLIMIITGITYASSLFSQCPSTTYGNGTTLIKYYSSSFCTTCWTQKKIINQYVQKHPHTLLFQEYDVDFCQTPTKAIPSFQINNTLSYGLHTIEQLQKLST